MISEDRLWVTIWSIAIICATAIALCAISFNYKKNKFMMENGYCQVQTAGENSTLLKKCEVK